MSRKTRWIGASSSSPLSVPIVNSLAGTSTIGAPSLPMISAGGCAADLAGADPLAGCGPFAGDFGSPSGTFGLGGVGTDSGFTGAGTGAGAASLPVLSAETLGSDCGLTGGFTSLSCARGLGDGAGAGVEGDGATGAGDGVDSDLGAIVSSANAGTAAQDNPNIILTTSLVTVDRTSMHRPRFDFTDPAQTPHDWPLHRSQGTEKRPANLGHPLPRRELNDEASVRGAPLSSQNNRSRQRPIFLQATKADRHRFTSATVDLSDSLHRVGISMMKEFLLPLDLQLRIFFVTEAVLAMHRDREFIPNGLELPVKKLV